jgi:hypothetical protein
VITLLNGLTIPPDLIAEIRQEASRWSAAEQELAGLKERGREVDAKRKRLKDLYIEGDIEKDEYRRRRASLDMQVAEIKRACGRVRRRSMLSWNVCLALGTSSPMDHRISRRQH